MLSCCLESRSAVPPVGLVGQNRKTFQDHAEYATANSLRKPRYEADPEPRQSSTPHDPDLRIIWRKWAI
jgi:hypothetical protein